MVLKENALTSHWYIANYIVLKKTCQNNFFTWGPQHGQSGIWKGWLPMSKLKKIWQGLVGFGCNLAWLIAYLCRSYSLVGTQIQQRQQSKLGTLHFSLPGISSLFGCKASNQKNPCLWWLSWLSCIWAGFHATMYHLVLKVVSITLFH